MKPQSVDRRFYLWMSHHAYGLLNCSFLKNLKNPEGMISCAASATQNQGFASPFATPAERSGNTFPGPFALEAVAFAIIVTMVPITCASTSEMAMWIRVRVCSSIMLKPTPCRASSKPSQSQRLRPGRAPATVPPGIHGTQVPMPETPQSIWAHRGALRPMAKMGKTQAWLLLILAK